MVRSRQCTSPWAFSDIIGNTERGVLAEYIVAKAIGALDALLGGKAKLKDEANIQAFRAFLFMRTGNLDKGIAGMEKAMEIEGDGGRSAFFKRYLDKMQKMQKSESKEKK